MSDNPMGECKICDDNVGSKPAARSIGDAIRGLWNQEVVVRPYQHSVEALAAGGL